MSELRDMLHRTADFIADYREGLEASRVSPLPSWTAPVEVDQPLPEEPADTGDILDRRARDWVPGLMGSAGPRYFGFVTGGSLDAALCADLLVTGWDQLAFNAVSSPASAAVEAVAGAWLKELLQLPESASVGFVPGCQSANTVGLAAARQHVLDKAGWNVSRNGLRGAPPVRVVVGAERHATIDRSLRLLGLGETAIEVVPAGPQGAMDTDALDEILAEGNPGPTIVCAQAGNVNTGACDDLVAVCDAAGRHEAWVHVDGAFGLWAAASPTTRPLVAGIERADSWACDGHKWLNVPYDSGFAFCAHPDAHSAAMAYSAAYLSGQGAGPPAAADFTPESSRRARGFAVYATIQALGRSRVADLVDRCCTLARRFAERLGALDGVEVVNDVVLNQVLARVGGAHSTDKVAARVQDEGECWLGTTTWHGERLLRISVSNWTTTESDIDRSVEAIARALLI